MGEHGILHHLKKVYPEFTHIPLIWWDTNKNTVLRQTQYSAQVDLAPTILDALGYKIPKTWSGISLLQEPTPVREVHLRTILRNKNENCFAISGYDGTHLPFANQCLGEAPQVFNLKTDPLALHPISNPTLLEQHYLESLSKVIQEQSH